MVSMSLVVVLVSLWDVNGVVNLALNDFVDVQLNLALVDWCLKPHDLS